MFLHSQVGTHSQACHTTILPIRIQQQVSWSLNSRIEKKSWEEVTAQWLCSMVSTTLKDKAQGSCRECSSKPAWGAATLLPKGGEEKGGERKKGGKMKETIKK